MARSRNSGDFSRSNKKSPAGGKSVPKAPNSNGLSGAVAELERQHPSPRMNVPNPHAGRSGGGKLKGS